MKAAVLGSGLMGSVIAWDLARSPDVDGVVVAEGLAADETNVGRVMTSPVETIDADARVGDALAMMAKLGVRRLPVTKGGKIVGMVTQKSVMGDRPAGQVLLPELSKPGQVTCPYCGAVMTDTKELSKHIDQAHVGAGLLEGNASGW